MKLNDFGILLTTTTINKAKILSITDNYRREQLKKQENEQKKRDFYFNNYERKRDEDEVIYNGYLQQQLLLSKKWRNSKNESDLNKLLLLERPKMSFPDDIYTIDIKKSNLK